MTSTNFAKLGAIGAGNSVGNVSGMGKSRGHEQEMASVFSSMMAQNPQSAPRADDVQGTSAEPVSSTQAYDRYQYQEKHVEEAKEVSVADKVEAGAEELEQYEQDAVDKISEVLGVEEDVVEEALEKLGFTAIDLLIPQNLAQVAKEITGIQDDAQLLLNGDFEQLLQEFGQMGNNLMAQMNLTGDQMGQLAEQMRALTEQKGAASQETAAVVEEQGIEVVYEDLPETKSDAPVQQESAGNVLADETALKQEQPLETKNISGEFQETDVEEPMAQQAGQAGQKGEGSPSFASGEQKETGEQNPFRDRVPTTDVQPQAEHVMPVDGTQAQAQEIAAAPSPNASYVASHVMDIINQVAENVRVVMGSESTSMEMQLNPENLGKIYLNVTTEAGIVSAHLSAQDEAVRAALESQLATLRESLNQAGIKVDAIEVTVATHEFEQNLEQNQGGEAHRRNEEQSSRRTRRNLSMDSLDELSGLMTEEEQLAAQIMRDNGNSVDFTA